jgi:hypothetical protein
VKMGNPSLVFGRCKIFLRKASEVSMGRQNG